MFARYQGLIAVIVLVTMLSFAVIFHVYGQSQQMPTTLYEGISYDATLLALDKKALEEAYHERILHLFEIWISSGAPADALNFKNGLRITRRAYAQAKEQIEIREKQLNAFDQQQRGKP